MGYTKTALIGVVLSLIVSFAALDASGLPSEWGVSWRDTLAFIPTWVIAVFLVSGAALWVVGD